MEQCAIAEQAPQDNKKALERSGSAIISIRRLRSTPAVRREAKRRRSTAGYKTARRATLFSIAEKTTPAGHPYIQKQTTPKATARFRPETQIPNG